MYRKAHIFWIRIIPLVIMMNPFLNIYEPGKKFKSTTLRNPPTTYSYTKKQALRRENRRKHSTFAHRPLLCLDDIPEGTPSVVSTELTQPTPPPLSRHHSGVSTGRGEIDYISPGTNTQHTLRTHTKNAMLAALFQRKTDAWKCLVYWRLFETGIRLQGDRSTKTW